MGKIIQRRYQNGIFFNEDKKFIGDRFYKFYKKIYDPVKHIVRALLGPGYRLMQRGP